MNITDYFRMGSSSYLVYMIVFGVFFCIFMYGARHLIYRHRRIQVQKAIKEAPEIANSMTAGQTVVKNLITIDDEKISEFLAPFTADKFDVHISNKRIGNNESNHLITVVKITKKVHPR